MQNAPSLSEVRAIDIEEDDETSAETSAELAPGRTAAIWVNRFTRIVGAIFLLLALAAWLFRHGHYRLVLAFLIVALFASILHSYTFEDGTEI